MSEVYDSLSEVKLETKKLYIYWPLFQFRFPSVPHGLSKTYTITFFSLRAYALK